MHLHGQPARLIAIEREFAAEGNKGKVFCPFMEVWMDFQNREAARATGENAQILFPAL